MTRNKNTVTGRWMRRGETQTCFEKPIPKQCGVCDLNAQAKGLCKKHYGDACRVAKGAKLQTPGAKCIICGGLHMAMGLCAKHYAAENNRLPMKRFKHLCSNAVKTGRVVSLTFEEFNGLIMNPCHYCGNTLLNGGTGWGLDRIDSTKGYDIANVVSCCWTCNYMKRDKSVSEWLKLLLNWAKLEAERELY